MRSSERFIANQSLGFCPASPERPDAAIPRTIRDVEPADSAPLLASGLSGDNAAVRTTLSAAPRELALRLDDDRDLRSHAREDLHGDLIRPERLEGLVELDLVAIDHDASAPEGLRDLLRADRAVELAGIADLHAHRQRRRGDAVGLDLALAALPGPL